MDYAAGFSFWPHAWLTRFCQRGFGFCSVSYLKCHPHQQQHCLKAVHKSASSQKPPRLTHLNWSRLGHREACCINKAVAISEQFKILISLGSGITHTPAIYTPQEWHGVLFPTVTHTGIPLHLQCPPMGSTRKGLVLQLGNGIFHISEKIQTSLIVCLYQSAKNGYKWNQGCERGIFFIRQMIKT